MYNLIIIDDIPAALSQLEKIINSIDCDFELINSFSSSPEAFDFMSNNHIDLVICDIKMPEMDGITFAKKCLEVSPDTLFVFMSAYRNFDYVKDAIRLNAVDYITKPYTCEELNSVLAKAHQILSARNTKSSFLSHFESSAQQRVFFNLLSGVTNTQSALEEEFISIGIDGSLVNNKCAICNLNFVSLDEFSKSNWKYGYDRLYNAISLMLPPSEILFCSMARRFFNNIELIFLDKANTNNFNNDVSDYLQVFKKNVKDNLTLDFAITNIEYFNSPLKLIKSNNTPSFAGNLRYDDAITKAIDYINLHYSESLPLSEIASHVSLSPTYFSALFKKSTGVNISEYISDLRFERALSLLCETNMPILSIINAVGYKSATNFYKIFYKKKNMTPYEYRNSFKK